MLNLYGILNAEVHFALHKLNSFSCHRVTLLWSYSGEVWCESWM